MRIWTMLALALTAVVALRRHGNEKTLDQGYAANHLPDLKRRLAAAMEDNGHSSSSGSKGKGYTSKFGQLDAGGNSGFVPAPPPPKKGGGGAGPSKGAAGGGQQNRNPNKRRSKFISSIEAADLGKRRKYKY